MAEQLDLNDELNGFEPVNHSDLHIPSSTSVNEQDQGDQKAYRVGGDGGGKEEEQEDDFSTSSRENTDDDRDYDDDELHSSHERPQEQQHHSASIAPQDLLLDFGGEEQQRSANTDAEFHSGVEDVIITPTAPEASFMNQLEAEENEATAPRSPTPPIYVPKLEPHEQEPDFLSQKPSITSVPEPVIEREPIDFTLSAGTNRGLLSSVADSTTPSSDERPVKMPKATTISPPSKSALARSSNSCSTSGCWTACLKQLDPRVWDIVMWRDPRVTGAVFAGLMFLLLSLACCSIFSIFSYTLLLALTAATFTRIGKAVVVKVHSGDDVHPFQRILEADVAIPEVTVEDYSQAAVRSLNTFVAQLRDLVLVKEYLPSLKLGLVLYAMTYIGAWFNGLTLLIIVVTTAFTLPKVYDVNRAQIDMYVEAVHSKYEECYRMLEEKVPYLKKQKTQ